MKIISTEYSCKECGHRFRHVPVIDRMLSLVGKCVDPAPTYALFSGPVCPKCGGKKLQEIK